MDARFELARRVADETARRVLQSFQSPDLDVEHKPDGTVVTAVDRDAEDFIRGEIEAAFPGDGILGEERPEKRSTSGWRWIVDPLDGTSCFVVGDPHFATLIGVEHDGEAMIGIASAPAMRETLSAARGRESVHTTSSGTSHPARVSNTDDLASAVVELADAEFFDQKGCRHVHENVSRALSAVRRWSDGYALILVATGQIDAAIHLGAGPWDLAPFMVIIEEAGGRLTDLAGRRTFDGPFVLASNGLLHEELVALVASPS